MLLQLLADLLGDGANVPVRPARRNHHEVTDGRLSCQIDRDHVLCLGLVEAMNDLLEQCSLLVSFRQKLWPRRAPTGTLKCGSHRVLDVLSSFTPRGLTPRCRMTSQAPGDCCGRYGEAPTEAKDKR